MASYNERKPLPVSCKVGNRFTILSAPRSGSFGLTYKANDDSTGLVVALKEYFPLDSAVRAGNGIDLKFTQNEAKLDLDIFRKEAAALGRCPSHPGIAQFLSADLSNNTGYLALEWIDGGVLTGHFVKDDKQLISWFLQLIDAVLHLNKARLAHRDIKPDNIMIRSDGSAVLVDLGAARLISGGATFDSRSMIMSPGFAAPEQFTVHGYQGVWTDLFGLCAAFYKFLGGRPPVRVREGNDGFPVFVGMNTPLRIRHIDGDPLLKGCDTKLLSAIDLGLENHPARRPRAGKPFLDRLGISSAQLTTFLPPAWYSKTLLNEPEPPLSHEFDSRLHAKAETNTVPFHAYQTAIIQSLDSARFQDSSFLSSAGEQRDNTVEQKIALARTEVFLNLMFGREIVLPAGHIADSEAIFAILSEVIGLYQDNFRERIDQACQSDGMPLWRPFRIAIEDSSNRDGYMGFVQRYKYTGAPLPLLQAADRSDARDFEEIKKTGVNKVRNLFLGGDYEGLETTLRKPGYAAYAARVAQYFTHDTCIFPVNGNAIESITGYAQVFKNHLDNDYVAGAGVKEARAKLPLVDKIRMDLAQFMEHGVEGATGFRGNWYVYAKMFEEVWPLARGYLDAKLYLTLASQYNIDHPILISQAYEYGKYDHSLILGPRFGQSMTEQPKLDDGLKRLTSSLTGPLPWEQVFELYLDSRFRYGLKELNRAYRSNKLTDYRYAIERHAGTIAGRLEGIDLDNRSGRLSLVASNAPTARMTLESYDAMIEARNNNETLVANGSSILPSYGDSSFNSAGISLLPLRHDLMDLGKGEPTLMHYFIKPLRLKIN